MTLAVWNLIRAGYVVRLFPDGDTRSTNAGFILSFHIWRKIVRREGAGHLIAWNNPLHLIRTILHTGAVLQAVLPLVGWVDHFEKTPELRTSDWSPFRDVDRKIFWLQRHETYTVRTAVEQDGHIILYDMEDEYEFPGRNIPPICTAPFRPNFRALMCMNDDARHWPQYLACWFSEMGPEQAITELQQIALGEGRFKLRLAQLPSTPRVEQMRQIMDSVPRSCQIWVGRYEVFEEEAGLFRKTSKQESPMFVTDVRCRIDSVFYNPRNARKIYRGHLLHAGKRIAFDLPVAEFEKDAIGAVTSVIHRNDLPEPVFHCKNRFYNSTVSTNLDVT